MATDLVRYVWMKAGSHGDFDSFAEGWEANNEWYTDEALCGSCDHTHGPGYEGEWECQHWFGPEEGPVIAHLDDGRPIHAVKCHCEEFVPVDYAQVVSGEDREGGEE